MVVYLLPGIFVIGYLVWNIFYNIYCFTSSFCELELVLLWLTPPEKTTDLPQVNDKLFLWICFYLILDFLFTCRLNNKLKSKKKTKNKKTNKKTHKHSQQSVDKFPNPIEKWQKQAKSIPLTYKYMSAHLVQSPQCIGGALYTVEEELILCLTLSFYHTMLSKCFLTHIF